MTYENIGVSIHEAVWHACGGAATRFGAGGSSPANEPLEQDLLEVAASIEDGEHDDRPPGDVIDEAMGAHHQLPPGPHAEAEQLRHQAAPAGMRHKRGGSSLETLEETLGVERG